MRSLFLLVGLIGVTFASTIEIKRGNVTVSINNVKIFLEKGEKTTLYPDEILCFQEGKGKVVIDGKIQLSARSKKRCYSSSAKVVNEHQLSAVINTHEEDIGGMTRTLQLKD